MYNLRGYYSSLPFLRYDQANWTKRKAMKPRSGYIPQLLAHEADGRVSVSSDAQMYI